MEQKFYHLCQQVAEENALELYHLEYRADSGLLRVMIQDPQTGGASIENCMQMDRALSPFIAREPWMPEKLTLEVSSPGLNRPLKSRRHFKQSIGKHIMVKVHADRIKGVLRRVEDDHIRVSVGNTEQSIPISAIKMARWEL